MTDVPSRDQDIDLADIKRKVYFRSRIIYVAVLGILLVILLKIIKIQFVEGPRLRALGDILHTRSDTIISDRGNIYTESGALLSSTVTDYNVHADLSIIDSSLFADNIDSLSRCMAELFPSRSAEQFKDEYVRAFDNLEKYHPIGKHLSATQVAAIKKFPIFCKSQNVGGCIVQVNTIKRKRQFDDLALGTIGIFTGAEASGLEAFYNEELAGRNGYRRLQIMAGNLWVPVEGAETETPPVPGRDIITTLDVKMQAMAEPILLSMLKKYECVHGTCIVMEVQTGKIRTLVNLGRQTDGSYEEDYNYATIPTEPGSTFMLVTLMSLLTDKNINVEQKVNITGGHAQFGNRTMSDSHPDARLGEMPIWKAFAMSSNVGMAKLTEMNYRSNPKKYLNELRTLRLDQPTGIDLLGERRSFIADPSSKLWSGTTLPWMATGYGVMITPLHTCMLYNAVANNGKMMRPYLVSAVREYGKDVKTFAPQVLATVCDSAALTAIGKPF